jgi:hypothetical protein
MVSRRVARWCVFKPKIQIWVNFGGSCNGRCRYILVNFGGSCNGRCWYILVNFGGSCNGRCWYILWTLGPFYGLLLYFMDIWYRSWKFGKFFPFWYFVLRKIWQPWSRARTHSKDYIRSTCLGNIVFYKKTGCHAFSRNFRVTFERGKNCWVFFNETRSEWMPYWKKVLHNSWSRCKGLG